MKRNIFFTLCCFACLGFTACSDDYADASSKHVYGEDENPYLRTDMDAQISVTVPLEVNGEHAYTVNLTDYTDNFEEKMGMSLDAVMSGLDNGITVFYPINTTRSQWLKTAYNAGTGWYFDSANQPCEANDENCRAMVTLNQSARTLTVELTEGGIVAGTVLSLNVGFAVNGPDYDNYLRFTFEVSVTDPTVAVLSVTFSEDTPTTTISLADYQENIEAVFDISYEDFLTEIANNENIKFSLADPSTNEWIDMGENYTANAPGYWMDSTGNYISWGVDGFAAYIEYYSNDAACGIGYNADLASGTTGIFNAGWVDMNDSSKAFHIIVSWTIQ